MWPFGSRTCNPAKDLPDLTGKVAIVTGGNTGIGYASVKHLVGRGAKVYIGARSEARAKAAIERLHTELGSMAASVEWFHLDLSAVKGVKEAAGKFMAKESRLDILINNAGALQKDAAMAPEGILDTMLCNYFGTYIFTQTLLPLLTKTARGPNADVRIVMMGSDSFGVLKDREVHFRTIDDYNETFEDMKDPGQARYSKTKLANTLYTIALQKHLDTAGAPVTVLTADPGWVWSEGASSLPAFQSTFMLPLVWILRVFVLATPEEGAHTSVFAAASAEVRARRDAFKGGLIVPDKTRGGKLGRPTPPQGESEALADELWASTEEIVKGWGL